MRRVAALCLLLASCTPPPGHVTLTTTARPYRDQPVATSTTTTTTSTTEPPTTTTTTEAPRPPVTAASRATGPLDCGGWYELVASYDWPVSTACRILMCESRGDPNARNPSGATGLFQILGGPTDAGANVALAYSMWRDRGWQPWVCK